MSWDIVYSEKAVHTLAKIDKSNRDKILKWLDKNIVGSANPKAYGKSLAGNLSGLWRYRVGDYRILCEICDKELVVYVFAVGHRKNIYKGI